MKAESNNSFANLTILNWLFVFGQGLIDAAHAGQISSCGRPEVTWQCVGVHEQVRHIRH